MPVRGFSSTPSMTTRSGYQVVCSPQSDRVTIQQNGQTLFAIDLTGANMTIQTPGNLTIEAGGTQVAVKAGQNIQMDAGNSVRTVARQDALVQAGGSANVKAGNNVTLEAGHTVSLKSSEFTTQAKKSLTTVETDFAVRAKEVDIKASGKVKLKGSKLEQN